MTSVAQAEHRDVPSWGAAPLASSRLIPIAQGNVSSWQTLVDAAADPNGFHTPGFLLPLCAEKLREADCSLLQTKAKDGVLTGQIPLRSAFRALRLPIPAAIANFPYVTLGTPLLAGDDLKGAAGALIDRAAHEGIAMLGLPMLGVESPVAHAFEAALAERGLSITFINAHKRAALDATQDAESYLRAGLGSKKLKELRRQKNRLADNGAVDWTVSRSRTEVLAALNRFLVLEAKGWKGERGSGLGQDAEDRAFVTAAAEALVERGAIEICELTLDRVPVAAGIVLKTGRNALFFKIAYDEAFARYSPGVQLTVALTRHLCANPEIAFADSTATQGHPMIDHVWRERVAIADALIPTHGGMLPKLCIGTCQAHARLRARAKAIYLKFFDGGSSTTSERKPEK